MAGGVSLGGAYFELTASSAGLIQALAQAEQASKKSVAAISAQTGIAEKDVQRLANTYVREMKRAADASAQSALKIIRAHNDAADAAEKAAKRLADSQAAASQKANAEMLNLVKGMGGFATAAVGVSVGAATVHKAMTSIAESTQKAAQAQFALNALYRDAAPQITKYSEDLAKASGRSRTEALEAATAVANLGRQYGFTTEQQEKLLQITANLAAIKGITLVEAAERVAPALRGEAEAAEYLGQVLNSDAVKALAAMTDEQRKNFETLSPVTKAHIVFGKLIADNADLMDKAVERANSAVGAYDKLTGSIDNLNASIGKRFQEPAAAALQWLTSWVEEAEKFVNSDFVATMELGAKMVWAFNQSVAGFDPTPWIDFWTKTVPSVQAAQAARRNEAGLGIFGPPANDVKAIQDQLRAEQQDAVAGYVKFVERAVDDEAKAREEGARRAAKAEDERIERAKIALEVERAARLKALEENHRNAMKALEAEEQAAEAAAKATIERLELERQAARDAAEEARDQALAALKAHKERLDQERELEDRARDDARQKEDQEVADARTREDQLLEIRRQGIARQREEEDRARADRRQKEDADLADRRTKEDQELQARRQREDRDLDEFVQRRARRRQEEDRDRQARREAEDRATEDRRRREDADLEAAKQAELDQIEAIHEARMDAIADEIQAVRDRKEAATRALDEEADRLRDAHEQGRRVAEARYEQESRAREAMHTATLRRIEDEADAARNLHARVLDDIDRQKEAEDDRHRAAMRAIDDEARARQDAVDAQIAALDALDEADDRAAEDARLQDAVTNARFGLQKAQSTGNQSEIVKAQQELDRALAAISRTAVQRERDAQRDVLKAQKDAIKEQADAQKRAEDDRNRAREREIQANRDVADAGLRAVLEALGVRRTAEQDAYNAERTAAQDAYDAARQAAGDALDAQLDAIAKRKLAVSDEAEAAIRQLQDRQDAEKDAYDRDVERINLRYKAAKDALDARRRDEDRALDDRRIREDQDLADRRKKEDDKVAADKLRIAGLRQAEDQALDARRIKEDHERSERRTKEDRDRDDRRIAEDLQARQAADRLDAQRLNEDRLRGEKRTAEDRERQDYRRAEDLRLSAQQAAVQVAYEAEQRATEAHFNGPNGVITQIKKAMEQAKTEYRLRKEHAEEQFRLEREALEKVYRNEAKTGLLDLQDQAAKNNAEKLASQLAAISSWKEQAGRWIDENKGKWNDLETAIRNVGSAISGLPNGGRPPAGSGSSSGGGSGGGSGPIQPPGYGGQPAPSPPPGGGDSGPGVIVRGGSGQWYNGGTHAPGWAVDIFAAKGTPIYAPVAGRSSTGTYPNGGNATTFSGDDGRIYYMAHGNVPFASGRHEKGSQIGEVGDTGNARGTSPHLHLAIASSLAALTDNGSGDIHDSDRYWKGHANGGIIDRASWLVDQRTGRPWGSIAEGNHPEIVVSQRATRAALTAMRNTRAPSFMAGAGQRPYQFAASAMPERLVGAGVGAAPVERQALVVQVGRDVLASWYVEGQNLAIRSGKARSDGSVRR